MALVKFVSLAVETRPFVVRILAPNDRGYDEERVLAWGVESSGEVVPLVHSEKWGLDMVSDEETIIATYCQGMQNDAHLDAITRAVIAEAGMKTK